MNGYQILNLELFGLAESMARPLRMELKNSKFLRESARTGCRRFIKAGMDANDPPWDDLKGQCFRGDDAFLEKLFPMLKEVRTQHFVDRPSLVWQTRRTGKNGTTPPPKRVSNLAIPRPKWLPRQNFIIRP